jgi:hypothetical protein
LLPELQYLGSEQVREKDMGVMKGLLETLYLLVVRGDRQGGGKEGRKVVGEGGTYLVVRELHREVEDEGVREGCERLVDVLMAVEDVEGEGRGVEEVEEDEESKVVEIF